MFVGGVGLARNRKVNESSSNDQALAYPGYTHGTSNCSSNLDSSVTLTNEIKDWIRYNQ